MRIFAILACAGIASALADVSFAGTRDPGVNARQHHQQARIAQGVRSGALTRGEAKSLRQEQRSLRTEERAYKADGQLDRSERKDLQQDLNQASRDIYQEKHDGELRGH